MRHAISEVLRGGQMRHAISEVLTGPCPHQWSRSRASSSQAPPERSRIALDASAHLMRNAIRRNQWHHQWRSSVAMIISGDHQWAIISGDHQ